MLQNDVLIENASVAGNVSLFSNTFAQGNRLRAAGSP